MPGLDLTRFVCFPLEACLTSVLRKWVVSYSHGRVLELVQQECVLFHLLSFVYCSGRNAPSQLYTASLGWPQAWCYLVLNLPGVGVDCGQSICFRCSCVVAHHVQFLPLACRHTQCLSHCESGVLIGGQFRVLLCCNLFCVGCGWLGAAPV